MDLKEKVKKLQEKNISDVIISEILCISYDKVAELSEED